MRLVRDHSRIWAKEPTNPQQSVAVKATPNHFPARGVKVSRYIREGYGNSEQMGNDHTGDRCCSCRHSLI